MSEDHGKYGSDKDITLLCEESRKYNYIAQEDFIKHDVKRGLRNADGTGVMAGITKICDVHGYEMVEGKKVPAPGKLIYRGIDLESLVDACLSEGRFGFEETAWLLLYGHLPTQSQLEAFERVISRQRELPELFVDDVIMRAPSCNIMNALQRSVLALYSYDDNADDISLENVMRQSISIIARLPSIMVAAYQVKCRVYDRRSMYFHHCKEEFSIAENILRTLRWNKQFTDQEAKTLDLCMMLHAEHGGGNNSTFSTRVLTSSATDTYSAISAGIGSLKGPRHGGANEKVIQMMNFVREGVSNWDDEVEITSFLRKIMDKEEGDGSGLLYGLGHAVYTVSDPRATILRDYAMRMAEGTDFEREFNLLHKVEYIAPEVFRQKKGLTAPLCANVDMYSGLVYAMLGIPPELFTPIFAISRTVGWCAHRIEEILTTGGKIIRPAYRAVSPPGEYVKISDR